jgi:hypothetical protein
MELRECAVGDDATIVYYRCNNRALEVFARMDTSLLLFNQACASNRDLWFIYLGKGWTTEWK